MTDELIKLWWGRPIKHLDSVRDLGTRNHSLVYMRDIAKKSFQVKSRVRVNVPKDISTYLRKCKYVSDKELFDKQDHWQTPDEFESNMKGDCEDHALWAWRKFVELGENARFMYGMDSFCGHAWVTIYKHKVPYIFEATAKPRFWRPIKLIIANNTEDFKPSVSIDKNFHFYRH